MYFSSAATACSTALSFLQSAAVAVTLLTFSISKLRKLLEKDNPLLADLPQELLRQLENEIDEYLAHSSHLDAFLSRLRGMILSEAG